MKLDNKMLVVYVLLGLILLLSFLMLLSMRSLVEPDRTPLLVIPTSKLSREAGAVSLNLLHGTVRRQLIDGRLPVHPTEKQSWNLWKSDPPESSCAKYETRYGTMMPRVWLVSYPRSGNTWTRYLLEAASGIFTGSVYTARMLIQNGFLGERDHVSSMRTLVQKTHTDAVLANSTESRSLSKSYQMTDFLIPTVLILRNPAKAIISFYKFKKNAAHPEKVPNSVFDTEGFRKFAIREVRQWMNLALERLLWTEAPLHVVYYERLVEDPFKELTGLLAFLGVPKDEGRMVCIASHLEGRFKSNGNKPLDPYTNEEKISFAAAAKAVNRTLQLLGYEPLPSYEYN